MLPPPYPPLPVKRPLSSAIQAGIICLAIGVCSFWLLGIGFYFIGLAAIMGVVAMCAHQVKQGLILLLASMGAGFFCGFAFVVIMFGAAAGTAAVVAEEIRNSAPPTAQFPQATDQRLGQMSEEALRQNFRQLHGAVSDHLQESLTPIIRNVAPRPAPKQSYEDRMRRQKLNELRARQGDLREGD